MVKTYDELLPEVISMILESTLVEGELGPHDPIVAIFGADSLDQITLHFDIEEKFNVDVGDRNPIHELGTLKPSILDENGILNDDGVKALISYLPYLNKLEIDLHIPVTKVNEYYSPSFYTKLIELALKDANQINEDVKTVDFIIEPWLSAQLVKNTS